ncbi:MAG: STAS domain-containing protein [Clostridia bacterium]|nr:STAS domain-containing protein [Clostridia bacterium]
MKIDLKHEDGTLTALLTGELDHHTAGDMREKIDAAALSGRCRRLVLDFSGISFMDSSGVGLIMGRYRLMQTMGGSLQIQGAGPRLERMIRLAGLDKLPIWPENEKNERKNDHETHQ